MLGNFANYIFGSETTGNEDGDKQEVNGPTNHYSANPMPPLSDEEEEWVVVAGGNEQPSLTLGSLNEIAPRPPTGSTGSSSTPSDDGIVEDSVQQLPQQHDGSTGDSPTNHNRQTGLSRTERRLTVPFGSCPSNGGALSLPEVKGIRAAQKSCNKDKTKNLSAKALERHNKTVKQRNPKKKQSAHLSVRSSGIYKQLKQC